VTRNGNDFSRLTRRLKPVSYLPQLSGLSGYIERLVLEVGGSLYIIDASPGYLRSAVKPCQRS